MAKVKIVKTPGQPAEIKQGGTAKNMFNDTLMYPNLVFNASTIGIINSNHLGTNDEQIAQSIGPVDREDANIEAEKGEVLVKPDLSGMYRVKGKTHAEGGTPIATPQGSFIFSNDKKLAFNDKEKELFQFKMGGDTKKGNTPAKVLLREVNPKEFNRLQAIIADDKQDSISKTSAAIMLQKMQQKMGQVALLQEAKKSFKNGVPDFAAMPQGDADSEQEVNENQYMAYGGYTGIPMMDALNGAPPPDETGKWAGDLLKSKNPMTGKESKGWNKMTDYSSPEEYAKAVGYTGNPKDIKAMQQFVMQKYPEVVDYYHSDLAYGQPAAGIPDDGKLGVRWNDIGNVVRHNREFVPPAIPTVVQTKAPTAAPGVSSQPVTGVKSPNSQLPWEGFRFQPNSAELLSIAAPGLQALSTPTYYDMLSQKYTPNVRLDRLDNSQEINDIKEVGNLGQQEAFTSAGTNPAGLGAAISAQIRANSLKGISQSNSGIKNANTQIANQESLINAQNKTGDNDFNIKNIHQTYNNNILSLQRRNEMYNNGFNQTLNNGLAVKKNLDSLSYAATAAALPSVTTMKDANGKEVLIDGPDGRKYSQLGVPIGFNNNRMPIFDPRFGGLDSFLVNQNANQGQGSELVSQATANLKRAFESGDAKSIYAAAQAYDKLLSNSSGKGNSPVQNAMAQMMQRLAGQ